MRSSLMALERSLLPALLVFLSSFAFIHENNYYLTLHIYQFPLLECEF